MGVPKHLHYAWKIVVSEAAAEAGVRLREHLRRLKAFGFADNDIFDVGGDHSRRTSAVNVVVTTGLERFHERALAAVTQGDNGHCGIVCVGANHARDIECSHLAHVGGADDRGRRVVFKSGQRERGLRAAGDFEAFALQSVTETFGKIDVSIDQKNSGGFAGDHHERASAKSCSGAGNSVSAGPGVSADKRSTSITSPPWESQPPTCGESLELASIISVLMSSHSPLTGMAIQSSWCAYLRVASRLKRRVSSFLPVSCSAISQRAIMRPRRRITP